MPPLESHDRWQSAVWVQPGGTDDYNEPVRGEAVAVRVRWKSSSQHDALPGGSTPGADVIAVVDREITDGWLWLGALADWNAAGSAEDAGETLRVAWYREIPDVKGRFRRRLVGLEYSRESEPEGA